MEKVSSDTKQLLEDCTYANGCIPGVDCEGCAVEVIMMVLGMMVKRAKALKKETELMLRAIHVEYAYYACLIFNLR